MPAYVIADVRDVRDQDALVEYRLRNTDAVANHGGRFLIRGGASELLEGVRSAMTQGTYVTPLLAAEMIGALTKPQQYGPPITPRQREVLRLLAEGKSMKEVAAALNLTVRTVAFRKYRMMEQQHIKSSAELVRFAVGQHIV